MAEKAAKVSEAISYFEYFPKEADLSRIRIGEDICSSLKRGYEIRMPSGDEQLTPVDIAALEKFQQIKREANNDLETIEGFVFRAEEIQINLLKILLEEPITQKEIQSSRYFFLNLAVSLGL